MMEEAPSGSIVVENEMEEIQHYHNTIYKCIDYTVWCIARIYTDQPVIYDQMINQLSIILLCDTQILNGLKNIETKCLAEAAKLFIGVWCIRNTDIFFICKIEQGNL
jgi:hypothetical protein